jgi:gentisate 1,2-dioxygenase
MTAATTEPDPALAAFHADAESASLRPLWLAPPFSPTPYGLSRPKLWEWATCRAMLVRAQEVMTVGADDEDRRILVLSNPTCPGPGFSTTRTLSASVQMVATGERAASHRHSMAALRFVIEEGGGCTIVDGEPLSMTPGDFILTPSWSWHGHTSDGDAPTMWLDIIDAPLVWTMDWAFFENYSADRAVQPPTVGVDDSRARFGVAGVVPSTVRRRSSSPLMTYKWADCRPALDRFAERGLDEFDGAKLRYTDPLSGGPVMPTVEASLRLLPDGFAGRAFRETASTIYHVAEGRGRSVVDGEELTWERGDTFCVPTWCQQSHSSTDGPAVLFSASDLPVLESVGLYRSERISEG